MITWPLPAHSLALFGQWPFCEKTEEGQSLKLEPNRDGPVLPRVFQAYGWSPRQVRYIRGVVRVETGDGVFALKKTSADPEHLAFLDRVFDQLDETELPYFLPRVATKNGARVVQEGEGCWYALPWYGQAAEKGDEVPPEDLIQGLARFHQVTEPLVKGEKETGPHLRTDPLEKKRSAVDRLKEWHEIAVSREFVSPFEKTFLSYIDEIEKAINFSVQGLEKVEGRPAPRTALIHGRLHPHNLLVGKSGWRWIDFDHGGVGSPVIDIAMFLRRFLPFDSEEVVDPFSLLDIYQKQNPLKEKEQRLLALHLTYPESVMRALSAYYQPRPTVSESASVRQLEGEIDRLHLFQEWVRRVWTAEKNNRSQKSPRAVAGVRAARKKPSRSHP